jgi:hypothetical protein
MSEVDDKRDAYIDAIAEHWEQELKGQPRELERELSDEDSAAIASLLESGDLDEAQLVEREEGAIELLSVGDQAIEVVTEERFEEIRDAFLENRDPEEALIVLEIGYRDVLERFLERMLERLRREPE